MNDVPMPRSKGRPIKPDKVQVLFRPDLGRQVRALAAREQRTISAQIQVLIERALSTDANEAPAA